MKKTTVTVERRPGSDALEIRVAHEDGATTVASIAGDVLASTRVEALVGVVAQVTLDAVEGRSTDTVSGASVEPLT